MSHEIWMWRRLAAEMRLFAIANKSVTLICLGVAVWLSGWRDAFWWSWFVSFIAYLPYRLSRMYDERHDSAITEATRLALKEQQQCHTD